jgi:hypothetical protein
VTPDADDGRDWNLTPEQEESIMQVQDETLNPTPEENFWDDRTTPTAYSRSDSERDLAERRAQPKFNPLQTWDQLVTELGDPTETRESE